jgi:hypothetical protein
VNEEQLNQAAAIFEALYDSDGYDALMTAHANLCKAILDGYRDAGFSREEAFQLMRDQANQLKVTL